MRTPVLHLYRSVCVVLMLTACVTPPSPEEMTRRAEQNQWELAHWGDRQVPHGDNGNPVILTFKEGKVSGHAGCNRYSAGIAFGPDRGSLKVSRGISTRMTCEPSRMEFESAFIHAFEASTQYRLEGESLFFENDIAPPLEFYRRPLGAIIFSRMSHAMATH